MFSPKIVSSDAFLDMPVSTQCLYFHLGMYADDDGFISPRKVLRMIGASEDDLKLLIAKRFVIPFDNGVVVIKHWAVNNLIRRDWYQETIYKEQKELLITKENGAYTEKIKSVNEPVNNSATEYRLGKVSIGKVNKDKETYGEFQRVSLSSEEYTKLLNTIGEPNTNLLIAELDTYIASKGKRYSSHYATILSWARRRVMEHKEKVESKSKGKVILGL